MNLNSEGSRNLAKTAVTPTRCHFPNRSNLLCCCLIHSSSAHLTISAEQRGSSHFACSLDYSSAIEFGEHNSDENEQHRRGGYGELARAVALVLISAMAVPSAHATRADTLDTVKTRDTRALPRHSVAVVTVQFLQNLLARRVSSGTDASKSRITAVNEVFIRYGFIQAVRIFRAEAAVALDCRSTTNEKYSHTKCQQGRRAAGIRHA